MTEYEDDCYASKVYWNKKYGSKKTNFEWCQPYNDLKPHFDHLIKKNDKILIPGCGNSCLSSDMGKDGYTDILSFDFSPVVIEQMKSEHADLPQCKWAVMDVRHIEAPDNTYDVVIDKCTIDALVCGDDDLVMEAVNEYIRVLKPGGTCLIISFGQEEDRIPFFDPPTEHNWNYDGNICLDLEIAPSSYNRIYKLYKKV